MNEDIKIFLKVFAYFLLFVIILVLLINFALAFSEEEKQSVCDEFLLTEFECFMFWSYMDMGYNQTCIIVSEDTCTNETIYVNNTIFSTEHIPCNYTDRFEFVQEENAKIIRLAEINAGCEECDVCEECIIPECTVPSDYIKNSDCDLKCSDAVVLATRNTSNKEEIPFWYYLIAFAIIIFVGFWAYKKFKLKTYLEPQQEPNLSIPDHKPEIVNKGGGSGW